ncbi:YceI family protein [Saccharicrinis sp. FJH54]|uniref:YceI family protein n=1 Tax=Saccharicrinis sp. FJH54 TaxID=3344665 RepID=UPI0035D4CA74
MRTKLFLSALCFVLPLMVSAQQKETFKLDKSNLLVKGTSSLHDWEMEAKDVSCYTATEFENNELKTFESISFVCKSNSLKSEHSMMDDKAYDALKVKKHPEIIFKLDASSIKNNTDRDFDGLLKGTLTLSGVSKKIEVPVTGTLSSSNQFEAKGSLSLKMSDYDIDPPTAMFGTITTGDKITVEYDFIFTKTSSPVLSENN